MNIHDISDAQHDLCADENIEYTQGYLEGLKDSQILIQRFIENAQSEHISLAPKFSHPDTGFNHRISLRHLAAVLVDLSTEIEHLKNTRSN